MQTKSQTNTQNNSHELLKEITRGLLYTHTRINANTTRTLEASSFLYALIELLMSPRTRMTFAPTTWHSTLFTIGASTGMKT